MAARPRAGAGMFFANRWVPMEVMNAIFILWAIAALIILGLLVWLVVFARSSKGKHAAPANRTPKKGKRHKR